MPYGVVAQSSSPIFVLSAFRSGSTLVRYLLDAHPAICCPAELTLGAFCKQAYYTVEPTLPDSVADEERDVACVTEVRRLACNVMEAYCQRKGKRRWCEKSPANVELLSLLLTIFPDASYICVHRHVLDQVLSSLEVEGPSRIPTHYLVRQRGNVTWAAMERWCDTTERLLALERVPFVRVHRIIYERLVEAPCAECHALESFLGVDVIGDLADLAFKRRPDPGPADAKIARTDRVMKDRSGRGKRLDVSTLPRPLRSRTGRILAELGYDLSEAASIGVSCQAPTPPNGKISSDRLTDGVA